MCLFDPLHALHVAMHVSAGIAQQVPAHLQLMFASSTADKRALQTLAGIP